MWTVPLAMFAAIVLSAYNWHSLNKGDTLNLPPEGWGDDCFGCCNKVITTESLITDGEIHTGPNAADDATAAAVAHAITVHGESVTLAKGVPHPADKPQTMDRGVEMNPMASSSAEAGGGGDQVAKLQNLSAMYERGLLTDDEFKAAKAKIFEGLV